MATKSNQKRAVMSVHVPANTADRLTKIAESRGQTKSTLVKEAVDRFLADEEALLARIAQGKQEIDAGKGISHEAVLAWANSLGTDNELPAPQAAT